MASGYTSKDPVADANRFQGEGINFRAKLIGIDDVPEARGDKMCQDTIQKLKAIVKISKEHKQRIIVNVSLDGLKILDQATANIDHTHEVHKISFISRDMTDSRAFGYIYGPGDGSHKFFGIKTEKAAENLVLSLRDLFQVVYELKKKEVEEAKKQKEETTIQLKDGEVGESDDSVYQVPQNGAPVEGTESEYAGIKQMNTFDSLFGTSPPVTSAAPSFDDAFGTSISSAAPTVSTQQPSMDLAGLGTPGPGTPFPTGQTSMPFQTGLTTPIARPGFGVSMGQPGFPPMGQQPGFPTQVGQAGLAAPGFGGRSSSPFGGRSSSPFGAAAAAPAFQQPTALQPPQRQAAIPVTSDPFANDPFSSPNPFGQTSTAGVGSQPSAFGAPAGNPFGAAPGGSGGFPSPPAANDSVGWPDSGADILAPTKLGGEGETEPESKDKKGSDFFGDLCDIGSMTQKAKTPKDMFKEKSEPQKKTLNQLKAENLAASANPTLGTPSRPAPAPPVQSVASLQPAADPFGFGAPAPAAVPANDPFGNVPIVPTTQQASSFPAHDPFGPLDKGVNHIPDLATKSADPFDTSSFLHQPTPARHTESSSNINASQQHSRQRPRPTAKKPASILNGESSNIKKQSALNENDFDLPSPDEPPPPLPSDALFNIPKNAPAPPPRPPSASKKSSTPVAVARSSSIKDSLSVQSHQSGASSSSDDQETLSSLSPISTNSSSDTSPVPAIPRRTKLSTSSDTSAPPILSQDTSSSRVNPPHPALNPESNKSITQKQPVPKPRKSLSYKSSIGSADGDRKKSDPFFPDPDPFADDPFADDPFAQTIITPNNNNICKDQNDNDPFLSSQPANKPRDFQSKWEAFSDFNCVSDNITNIGNKHKHNQNNTSNNNTSSLFGDPF
ncbi:disabled homolog 1 isoform X2 [Patella vulgata]|uniref:disabled homolog 1 isoform X2 n=1 Tax=Patella vulgata TaxID=6465 RepID=UPI0024A8320E|nr:disabled homolog 1 isoform X2 [Patella vulgata]